MSKDSRTYNLLSASDGVGFGCALAIAVSYSEHHSLIWAMLHGVCSWLYVIYFAVTRG
jgi:hypothetical protein